MKKKVKQNKLLLLGLLAVGYLVYTSREAEAGPPPPPPPPPPGKATLNIYTTPAGAEVFVDGESYGPSPLSLEMDPGTYIVSFGNLTGYYTPDDISITLNEGDAKEITQEYTESTEPPPEGVSWVMDLDDETLLPLELDVYYGADPKVDETWAMYWDSETMLPTEVDVSYGTG